MPTHEHLAVGGTRGQTTRFRSQEKRFFDALRDVFVGARVEGESGYINMMRIKSSYYEKGVFPKLRQDINEALKPFPAFREELFEKLYDFFYRYFSESGSIYFRYTPLHQNVYEKVYTDDKDVMLFWKTHMLYYVKTDRLFKSMEVEIDGRKFFFDVSTLEHKKANEKRELVYTFKEKREDGALVFTVTYSEKGKKTKTDDILKTLRKNGDRINEETLERAFRVFEKQSEVDYFINKDAKAFLEEQFDLWMYQYMFKGVSEWTQTRIKQLQTLKDIAYKIIAFISQFENELVKIWNKPKFVLNSNYVITLDRIAEKDGGLAVVEKLLAHKNFKAQVEEWQQLGIVDKSFKNADVLDKDLTGKRLAKPYQHLPIDTKYFKDMELEILGLFDNLDASLDGWLIKSENYQALKTILPKFRERVQTIYIDPPFNKEQDADYLYNVKYKDSTWASMLENRLRLARDLLNERGSIFVRCDYNGNWIVRPLMNEIFGEESFRNEITIRKSNIQGPINIRFNPAIESLYFYSSTDLGRINPQYKEREAERNWLDMHSPKENPRKHTIQIHDEVFIAPKGRHWTFSQETVERLIKENRIRIIEKEYIDVLGNKHSKIPQYLMSATEVIDSNWTDIQAYSQTQGFPTENSEILLKRVIESTSYEGNLIMDFFLGSGTTTAVAHKLKRKWIGVEMGEHFWTVVLPRMKNVLAYDKSGISKEVKEYQGGGFFKYYELEQYEDTLRRTKYADADLFDDPNKDPYHQYVFLRDLKMLEALEVDTEKNTVKVDLSRLYDGIDIAETLSNLTGKWIKRITADSVEFEDGEVVDTENLDWKRIKPLIWW
jgi:adenine-specific DNA-methyltransferase